MRTFLLTINGVARVYRTYAMGPGRRSITPDIEGHIAEVVPAPHMADVIAAKWTPEQQAEVTSIREIDESDIPAEAESWMRAGWQDDGAKIVVNMDRVRAAFEAELRQHKMAKARELQLREDIGEDVAAERAALQAMAPDVSKAQTPDALKALWPTGLPKR